ncbi:MAG: hypothetical protein GWP07_05350, partial [Xanthomonadaceae bacterium]|nr:hypothetical protein [Xanthomonadaceae bacterium]
MEMAAVKAIQEHVSDNLLSEVNIIPRLIDFSLAPEIARQVAMAAVSEKVNRKEVDPDKIRDKLLRYVYEGELAILPVSTRRKKRAEVAPSIDEESLELHKRYLGVVGIEAKIPVKDIHLASILYSAAGVSDSCKLIMNDPDKLYDVTVKSNLVAVVSDGSAVLGLGNI